VEDNDNTPPDKVPIHPTSEPMCHRFPIAFLFATVLAATAGLSTARAQEAAEDLPCRGSSGSSRPRVGLALSGGGARGIAHVGVLKTLEELRLPVDCIAGTSMGAVVGGLYAAGVPLEELENLANEVNWSEALRDRPAFRDRTFRRKEDGRRYLTGLALGLEKQGLNLGGGLWSGQKLEVLLRGRALRVAGITDFSRMPIPFRAVATDLETGKMVVLRNGDLPRAIRASMAIPGVFSPVELHGLLLVDGGVANNLPVDVVRAMGADVVIAVDISEPLLGREDLSSPLSVVSQTLAFLTQGNMEPRRQSADILIQPDLEGFGFLDFAAPQELIARGRAKTLMIRQELTRLATDETTFAALKVARERPDLATEPLAFVRVEGNQKVDERLLLNRLHSRAGLPLEREELEQDVAHILALDDFQQVAFALEENEHGQKGLVLRVEEKPWTTELHASLELLADHDGETAFTGILNATTNRLNPLGAAWRNDLRLGRRLGIFSEIYQPLTFSGTLFVAPRFELRSTRQNLYQGQRKISEFDLDTLSYGLDLGLALGNIGELRVGFQGGRLESKIQTGNATVPEVEVDLGGLLTRLTLDTVDNPTFPRHGFFLHSALFLSRQGWGADDPYDRLEISLAGYGTHGRHTFSLALAGGSPLGTRLPFYDEFLLGGPLALSALDEGQLRGQRFAYGRLAWYRQVLQLPTALGDGVFVGTLLEAGNVWQGSGEAGFDDLLWNGTVFAGADTLLGPVIFGYSKGSGGKDRVVLTVGRSF